MGIAVGAGVGGLMLLVVAFFVYKAYGKVRHAECCCLLERQPPALL